MNFTTDCGFAKVLYCEICNYVQFSSYEEFYIHHLIHVRQPFVKVVKLNPKLSAKLQIKSYKINKGVARRSHPQHVPPLKISVLKQQGTNQFQVIKKDNYQDTEEHISNSEKLYLNSNSHFNSKEYQAKKFVGECLATSEVEGKNLLERFGAQISVSRKGKPGSPVLPGNAKHESETCFQNSEAKTENLLERLSGIGGISILPKVKSSPNGNSDSKPSTGISISSKLKSIDINELKKLKDQDIENDRKLFDKNIILRKLSGSGSISIAAKAQLKGESFRVEEQENMKEDKEAVSPRPGSHESFERLGMIGQANSHADNPDPKNIDSTALEGHVKCISENSSESPEQKKFVRVKNSTFKKRPQISHSPKESSEESTGTPEDPREPPCRRESGIDILERLTENLNTVVKTCQKLSEKGEDSASEKTDEPLLGNISGGENRSDSSGVRLDGKNSQFNLINESNKQDQECPLLLTPPGSSCQDGEGEDFGTLSSHTPDFGDTNNEQEDNGEINENADAFNSLTSEDESHEPSEQQNAFWPDMPNSSKNIDQPAQDPLLTPDSSVPNGEGLNQNFLHNFLSEPQPPPSNIPAENSEFMSLDRLGQTQHQQPSFNMPSSDPNTPMEQLSQQVQRIPNPTPQINVISQHHMQAPQPPQMHTGVPMSPQHISPQQPNSYEALGHMQPPMPPPLYQGYNMYNQSFPPQTPQQMPRPPILQQRPHIQPRSFQSLAAPRPRVRPMKRNSIRLPTPDIPSKQLRMDPPLQTRPQLLNTAPKLPSGITITPPKKALEANKVANVLASRGITVTPAASRQTNQVSRPQQRNASPNVAPTLNISSAVSITSSAQNRNSGGFAVPGPGPRRTTPVVNHHVDRPERCTTVDLTVDDEAAQRNMRLESPQVYRGLPRYTCKLCGKIFSSAFTLESHKSTHRPLKCDKCSAPFTTMMQLQQHKFAFHKMRQQSPDLAIPIVDLNHPGAREQLLKCGIQNYIPMSQLQSNNNGYFGVPIIQLDTAKEKAVSNLSILGAGNILVLGKMKALVP